MMQIVYFSEKAQLLEAIRATSQEKIFITPSPAKADNLRVLLGADATQDVITISKFTDLLLTELWPDEAERPAMKRKSELLLIFGILKHKFLPRLGFEQFSQAYNLFSDLRSYSLNLDALSPVLDEQPKDIRKAFEMFFAVLGAMQLFDEHGAYQAISEGLRSADELPALKKTFIFWGFQHLNGQQVDLMKSLAIRYDVIIPFPASLRSELKRSDWVSWLLDHKVTELELPATQVPARGRWLPVNSRELAKHLAREGEGAQIVLGVSKLTTNHTDLLPFRRASFKIPHEILKSELQAVFNQLLDARPPQLGPWLAGAIGDEVARPGPRNFRRLKVLQLYQEALAAIALVTDELPATDDFFLKLLREVVALNQPRTSFVPTFAAKPDVELFDMGLLEGVDRARKTILCVDERFDDFQSLAQPYPESTLKALAALGPIRRNELELLFKQWELRDLFRHGDVLVLMPAAVLKHSLVWKKVFSDIELTPLSTPSEGAMKRPVDTLAKLPKRPFSEHFSASKFQTYYDCPRKFYFGFVDRLFPELVLETDIDNKVSGTLVHRIIEFYFDRKASPTDLPAIAREVLDAEILKHRLAVPADVYADRLLTFTHRARNGITLLQQLEATSGQKITWKIEQKFDHAGAYHIKGAVDCVGVSDTHVWLLDFKSTKGAAASITDVSTLESLQLWVYTLAAENFVENFAQKSLVQGYVVLDEPKKSNIFFEDLDLKDTINEAKFCAPTTWKGDCRELLEGARKKLEALATQIKADHSFVSKPRTASACHFCELAPICLKGEAHVDP